jgi:hypothetical protein
MLLNHEKMLYNYFAKRTAADKWLHATNPGKFRAGSIPDFALLV